MWRIEKEYEACKPVYLPWVQRLADAVAADRDLSRLAEIAEDEWPAVLDCVAVLAAAAQQRRAA